MCAINQIVKDYGEAERAEIKSDLLRVLMALERSQDFDGVRTAILENQADIAEFNEEEQRILNMAVDLLHQVIGGKQAYSDLKDIIYAKRAKGVNNMLADVIKNAQNYEAFLIGQGEAKGERNKAIETAKRLFNKALSNEDIAEATDLDTATIEDLRKQYNKENTD